MSRLPMPGGDDNNWGSVLNDYLRVIHKDDGNLKDGVISENKLSAAVQIKLNESAGVIGDGTITRTKLSAGVAATLDKADTALQSVTKADIGLGDVQNTSDINKPISTATQAALDTKADITALQALTDTVNNLPGSSSTPSITDAVGEWWTAPMYSYQEQPYQRTVFGAISATGKILANEFNHATGKVSRYELATAIIDDHCVPALWVKNNFRPLIAWTHHNADNIIRFKAGSRDGSLGSLVSASTVNYDIGTAASYTQIHYIANLSSANTALYWVFFRRANNSWQLVPVTVDQISGSITFGARKSIVNSPGRQCYISTVDAYKSGDQVIRVYWGYNPAQPVHAIYYIEINCVSGVITSPFHPALNANISGTNLPVLDTDITPMVPEMDGSHSRRLHYGRPGPDLPAVGVAEWTIGSPDAATYKLHEAVTVPTAPGGLIPGATGYATGAYNAAMNIPAGFEIKTVAKFAAAPTANAELARRFIDSNTNSFYHRITPSRTLTLSLRFAAAPFQAVYTSPIIPGNWTDLVGYGWRVDRTAATATPMYSLDGGTNWTSMAAIPILNQDLGVSSASPLIIPTSSLAAAGVTLMSKATLKNLSETLIAGFEDLSSYSSTDAAGRTWSLSGDASIQTTVPQHDAIITTDFGATGPRVGYDAEANYVAGVAFQDPSYDQSLVVARRIGTTDTIEMHRKSAGGYTPETLATSTGTSRIVRPGVPLGGGPIPALYTQITAYSPTTYTDYQGNIRST